MFTLSSLLLYPEVIIQCHDNPDADSLASGYALHEYFSRKGKKVQLIYSGRGKIVKSNLIEMIKSLKIPITHVNTTQVNGLLITVDCQYGAKNVTKISSSNIAMIDHHEQKIFDVKLCDIRPYLGSCSTLVWQLLTQENFDFNINPNVATALYYGLCSDTNNLTKIYHPLDKDMRDTLTYNRNLIRKLQNSNFTLKEIQTAMITLANYCHNPSKNYAIIKSNSCDITTLDLISDTILQVDVIDIAIVYNEIGNDIRFAVHSCIAEVMADELTAFLTDNIGFSSGNMEKGNGYINFERLKNLYPQQTIESYLNKRIEEYYRSSEIIYYNSHNLSKDNMDTYKKKKVIVGAVHSIDIFPEGSPLLIRALEGDVEVISGKDIYIMIGICGEVYPIRQEKYKTSYQIINQPFQIEAQYSPTVHNLSTKETVELMSHAHACIATGDTFIYARSLTKRAKVFTRWDYTRYISGKAGDYLVRKQDDIHDIYIVQKTIFEQTYETLDKQLYSSYAVPNLLSSHLSDFSKK